MRYAATIQPHPEKPPLLIGVGETHPEALGAARVWFQKEFDRTNSKEWNRLYALQDGLSISTEDEFATRTGVSLDEWLARMAAAGVTPAKAAAAGEEGPPLVVPSPPTFGAGGIEKLVYAALLCVLLVGSLATMKYLGGRLVDRTVETALSNSNTTFGTGPVVAPAIGTFDPDDLWGDFYGPSIEGTDIDGVISP